MDEKRRIAVVIPKYGLVGGAEGFAAELTGRIASDPRFEVHLFANRWAAGDDRVAFHQVPVVRFPRFLTTPSFAWFARRRMSAEGPFDVVHAHDRIFRADLATLHGIPHRRWIRDVRRKRMSLFDRATARMEDRLVLKGGCRRFLAVSSLARKIFLEEYPVDPGLVTILHPGVDTAPYERLDRERCRREVRNRYGIGLDEPLILFVSMNFHIKGLDRVLRGLAHLRKGDPGARFRLLVVGRGDENSYGRLATELGLGGAVIFAGAVAKEKLPECYLSGDGYAMLSRFDTFGMVVLEAMAAGLPVLVGGQTGARDLVRDGENGFVIEDPDDAVSVAGRMRQMLNGDHPAEMAMEARRTAREHSWDKVASEVVGIYESIWSDRRLAAS